MNPKALIIFTYSGQQEMLERHLPGYRKSGADLIFVYPVDAPVQVPLGATGLGIAKSEHYGMELSKRTMIALRSVVAMGYETICCIEGDSIVLGPMPDAPESGVDCFLYDSEGAPRWKSQRFVHWPWLMGRTAARFLALNMEHLIKTNDIEGGFPDRLMAYAADIAFIPLNHRPDLAYSRNALDCDEYFEQARAAIKSNVRFIHGLKTKAQLDRLLAA